MDILWNCFYFLGNELIHHTKVTCSEPSVIKDWRLFLSYGRSGQQRCSGCKFFSAKFVRKSQESPFSDFRRLKTFHLSLRSAITALREVILLIRLKDSRQQLTYVLEEIRAIRSVALLADEEPEWDTEGDIVRLIALATEPVMRNVEDVISTLDAVITEKTDAAVG